MNLRAAPDEIREVRLLPHLAVDGETDRPLVDVTVALHRADGADGRGEGEVLPRVPRAALVARLELQIAAGHVETGGISVDDGKGIRRREPGARLANGDDQLGLVMVIRGHRRIRNRPAPRDERLGELAEEEGRLTIRIGAHLARVGRVVATDTEDAADREALVAPGDGRGGKGGEVEDERHENSPDRQDRTKRTVTWLGFSARRTSRARANRRRQRGRGGRWPRTRCRRTGR